MLGILNKIEVPENNRNFLMLLRCQSCLKNVRNISAGFFLPPGAVIAKLIFTSQKFLNKRLNVPDSTVKGNTVEGSNFRPFHCDA